MMKSSFIALSLLFSATLFATEKDSYYSQLESWFEAGTAVNFENVDGIWTGRCFDKPEPSATYNAALVSLEQNAVGPGLGSETTTYLGILHLLGASPDHFDDYTDFQYLRKQFRNDANRLTSLSVNQTGDLFWLVPQGLNSKGPDMKHTIRMYNGYLVVQAFNTKKNNTLPTGSRKTISGVKVGPFRYCYFFKKLN